LSVVINPDILILDEILSVGDMAFNKKSFNKIQEFKNANKTILLCSHSLNTIKNFCSRVIWINEGIIQDDGDPETVTANYASYMNSK
jgi:ABC-type polysaccharide/polyol phosphate transport system ATPase subunit